jgi:hypothetical protein
MKKEKKIPTVVGLVILLLSIIFGVIFNNSRRVLNSRASTSCNPINPQITNITDKSFDISFITSGDCATSLLIDNRTLPNFRDLSKIHYFQVNNLKENYLYSYSFLIDGSVISSDNYKGQTAKKPNNPLPTSNLAWGRVLNADLTPAENTIVYLNMAGASPLSAFVTKNGNWNIPLSLSFNYNKDAWFNPAVNTAEDFIVISPDPSKITQITGNTSNNNPVPDIILGKNSFSVPTQVPQNKSTSSVVQIIPTSIPTPTPVITIAPISIEKKLTIDNPKEGESVFSLKPDFFGSAPINSQISIKLDSISGTATSDSSGNWHWSPFVNLKIGDHTISVTLKKETVIRKFKVATQSIQSNNLSFSATPSAVIITPIPTVKPTIIPTVRAARPSTVSGVPKTGFNLPTVLSLMLGIISISISFIFIKNYINE